MADLSSALSDTVQDKQAFRREQIEMLYRQLPLIYLADVVAGGFLFFILFRPDLGLIPYLWCALLLVTTSIRALLARQHVKYRQTDDSLDMRWRFLIAGAGLSGLIWGNAWLLLPEFPEFNEAIFVVLWLAGMQAGASTTMATIKEVFLAFTVPASTILLVYLFVEAADYSYPLIGAYVMYLCFILPIALRIGRDFNHTLVLQTNNAALSASLELEEDRLERKQEELAEEKRRHQALQAEKAAADEKLRVAAEERLLLLDTVGEGIFGLDNRGNITFINSTALKMLGYQESDVLGKSALPLISTEGNESPANVEAYLAISRSFQQSIPVHNMECHLNGAGSLTIPVRFSCAPIIKDNTVTGAVVSFSNISQQKEIEAMLLQAQKMEAIGRLTGGVAHDFNNLLTVVLGNLQFLKHKLDDDDPVMQFVDKTMQAARNGAELNSRLLSFSREQDLETALVDVNEVLKDMEAIVGRLLGENIELRLSLDAEDVVVLTDRAQLENAILNLCLNARDAMPDGGVLKIETRVAQLQKSYVRNDDSVGEGEFIEIDIIDNGMGIAAELQEQIFEPFFTTKEKDQGTGLGLATVYGFLRQSGGNITVASREGEWTTFKVFLPVAETVAVPSQKPEQPEQLPRMESYSGKVLVVEDDDNVREVAVLALEEAGYDVLPAADGREGLAVFEENSDIDFVFSDVIMPGGLTGIDMAERILEKSPKLPILLATGYTEKAMKDRMIAKSHAVFISKPYETADLPGLIHSMMMKAVS